MKRSTNSVEVKRQNRNRVFRYVNGQEETSMPEISAALDISGPTVLTIVNELKEEGVLKEAGELKSTGGRKAKAIAAVKDIKYAVGIDLTANHISITYTDLSEKALKHVRIRKSFEYTNEYLDALAVFTRRFIEENAIPEDKILGIGISMPCIIDRKNSLLHIPTHWIFIMYPAVNGKNILNTRQFFLMMRIVQRLQKVLSM